MLGFERIKRPWVATCSLLLLLLLAACGGGEPGEASFDLSVVDGALAGDESTFVAAQGDTVTLNLTSDVAGEVHLHGYDLKQTVAPGAPSAITFEADATGRFPIEMHTTGAAADEPHEHDGAESDSCGVDVTGMAIHLTAEPTDHAGHYLLTVEIENFELSTASGNHWHLTSDGQTVGMYFDPSAEVDLGEGMHELVAQLNTDEHCALPVSDSVMVGEEAGHDDHDAAPGDGAATDDDHEHDEGGEDFNLGALEIRPR